MGGSKKNKLDENEEINFNDSRSFEKIVSQLGKGKSSGFSFKDVPKKVIGFLTGNVKSVALIAAYILLCGIGINLYWICKIDFIYILVTLVIIIFVVGVIKIVKRLITNFKKKK